MNKRDDIIKQLKVMTTKIESDIDALSGRSRDPVQDAMKQLLPIHLEQAKLLREIVELLTDD